MKISSVFRYLFSTYALSILFLLLIRIILLSNNWASVGDDHSLIFRALLNGVWFDNVIVCSITSLPLLLLTILSFCRVNNKLVIKAINIYYIILISLSMAIAMSDIPYFNYFFKHMDASIFNWKDDGAEAILMILQEKLYYMYFLIYIVLVISFAFLVLKAGKTLMSSESKLLINKQYCVWIPITLIIYGSCFLGMRGTTGRKPINTSHAYFSDNSFLNQLGLNPTFFFIKDILNRQKEQKNIEYLVDKDESVKIIRSYLNIDSFQHDSPIARQIKEEGDNQKKNVVLIFMESMSMNFLNITYKGNYITPYLKSLKNKALFFDNFYSMGTHTNQGVWSTLSGLPSFFDENIMRGVRVPSSNGLASILKQEGYQTFFLLPHEPEFDNMKGFLVENGFEHIYSQDNYPKAEIVNTYGVSDKYLLNYSLNKLNTETKRSQPFFATILTVSNHPPYVLPKGYDDRGKNATEQMVAYADDCLKNFMESAAKEEWFKNTIFVFLGDHGQVYGKQLYDMPLSYNHIPLFIYSPSLNIEEYKPISDLGCQMDVLPTVMGLLNISYVNNTLGIDLFKEKRRFVSFTSDNIMGCVDHEKFYMYSLKTKSESLYYYRDNSKENIIENQRSLADSMRLFSASQLVSFKYLYNKGLFQHSTH